MLASSPSPSSAALRSPLQTSSGAASHPPRYEPTGAPHFNSPRSSRLAIDELRSALNRHTVDPSSPEFSGDLHRRRLSASTAATKTPVTHSSALASASSSQPDSSATPSSATPSTKVAASSVPNPPVPSVPPSMPAPIGSGSNKRNSQSDDPPDATDPELEGSQSKRLCSSKSEVKVLPAQYELAEPRDLVVLISSMLMELIRFNDKIPLHQGRLTRFHSRSPPRISVQDYLQRLTTHATLSPPILLSMVYYIDRLCALYPAFTVSSLTIHRFLIASATVASKGLSDSFWTNKTYSRVGGISMTELAMLELEFLFRVQWRIVPQPEVLVDYYQSLVERCEGFIIERTSGGSNGVQFSTVNATSIS
ncbi:hypothetical protein NUU61_002552 [Penicillium alfredii]|uniref:Cyclin-dependent protein kinase regulator Pho80 n=1 Tax=Penicillium alfredii TaxID=1506179 RepID=A0A9W9FRU1_9EURO|nr:uncharacterized protein NUU61_002552 [Penicillium alfredii]KAJ5105205.1 hypothetical protein NUU61_002552 [Penicillium alfredii]